MLHIYWSQVVGSYFSITEGSGPSQAGVKLSSNSPLLLWHERIQTSLLLTCVDYQSEHQSELGTFKKVLKWFLNSLPVLHQLLTTTCYITVISSHSGEEVHHGDNNDIIKEGRPTLGPSKTRPTYTWTRSSQTECSTSCGTGEKELKRWWYDSSWCSI